MANKRQLIQLSKFLAVMLRHNPEKFGLQLDEHGFASLEDVWQQIIERYGDRYSREDLATIIAADQHGKKRYEQQGDLVRAMYGHSLPQDIQYEPAIPPDHLYHGTSKRIIPVLKKDGLRPMSRQFVHLTTSADIAGRVAQRHDRQTVLLTVQARAAHDAGHVFHHPEAEHYLVKLIPPEFIIFPSESD